MSHPIHRVESFRIEGPYTLRVRFADATEQLIHFEPMLAGDLYRPLRHIGFFNQVRIDPEVHTLVWPDGADFDPATLHDWPQHAEAMITRAKQWEMADAGRREDFEKYLTAVPNVPPQEGDEIVE